MAMRGTFEKNTLVKSPIEPVTRFNGVQTHNKCFSLAQNLKIYEKTVQFHVKILGGKNIWDEQIFEKKPRCTGGPRYRGARYRGGLL